MTHSRSIGWSFLAVVLVACPMAYAAEPVVAVTGARTAVEPNDARSAELSPFEFESVEVSANTGTVAGGFPSLGVDLLSVIPLSEFGGGGANDVWGYTTPGGREYAIIGLVVGTGFVDVTDPRNPIIVAVVPDAASTWSDIAVFGEYAYNVNESSGGIQVLDLSRIDEGLVTDVGSAAGGVTHAHNVYANTDSGYLYACSTNVTSGFVAYDLTDPANPNRVGTWSGANVHDLQVVSYASCPFAGRAGQPCEIAFTFSVGRGVVIVDVTDKAAMVEISSHLYPNVRVCHQGWLSDDRRHLFFGDEGDETGFGLTTTTYVLDVQDLANPTPVTNFTNGLPAIDHNLMLRGDFVLEANYTTGLRIYDASNLANVQEVGFFDTFPQGDFVGFSGAWGIYSLFPSGIVLISDANNGLFMLDVFPTTGCQTDRHCDDSDPCTTDTCGAGGVCSSTLVVAGSACVPANECVTNASCDAAGACVGTDINTIVCVDDAVCAPGMCDTGAGVCVCAECNASLPPFISTGVVSANRCIGVTADNPGQVTALRVTLTNLPSQYAAFEGQARWVAAPTPVSEMPGIANAVPPMYLTSRLSCDPVFMDWSGFGPIQVCGEAIVPGAAYDVQAIGEGCVLRGVQRFSRALSLSTSGWGDVVGSCAVTPCSAPDGSVDVTSDVVAILLKFSNASNAPAKARADLEPSTPDFLINISDVVAAINGFSGKPYPFAGPSSCP